MGYTYGKSLDHSSSLAEAVNPFGVSAERALSAFDMRHNFVASYEYTLPFDKLFRSNDRATEGGRFPASRASALGFP